MIAANSVSARFLTDKQLPALRRIVRTPNHWDRIVEIAAEMGDALPEGPDSRALSAFLEKRRAAGVT